MIGRDTGHLVTVSSAAGILGVTGLADYCASKFAVFGFHEAMRMELHRRGSKVRTTIVCPYYIDTGMFAGVKSRFSLLLPILKSEDVARRTVLAILKNRQRLIMPGIVRGIFFLRVFPVWIFDKVIDFLGVSNSMDDFKGRNH
jgi:all-trans-retinol dehydrogenase (NAD+)